MINIQNLGSQKSIRVKYICHILFNTLVWKRLVFVILLSWDGFKCNPETKVQNNNFVKSVQKQLYTDVLQNSNLKNFKQVFCCEYCKIIKNSIFIETSSSCFFQFDEVTAQYWVSANLLFLIKHTMWDGFS